MTKWGFSSPKIWFASISLAIFVILFSNSLFASAYAPQAGSTATSGGPQAWGWGTSHYRFDCYYDPTYCTDTSHTFNDYVGHDEPSLLFYSDTPGSGNAMQYSLRLPEDPPTAVRQAGTGGTDNFMLHPAFWFGMAMCDTQSYPEYTNKCTPDSDSNIFNSPNPNSPQFIGRHPGAAFMEMQFYPPGWLPFSFYATGISCSATQWCAALNIDSLGINGATGQGNNNACANTIGLETVNFAFITYSGKSQAPANPVYGFAHQAKAYTPNPTKDLFMNSGDWVNVNMFDTSAGFKVVITDLTTGKVGSMTASTANGFGQVKFDPKGKTCVNIPYAFHPMYSTSTPNTRVPWAAHSYNVAFSDEIGHFEYCNGVNTSAQTCTRDGYHDLDTANTTAVQGGEDDYFCGAASQSLKVHLTGCTSADWDFDGVPYLSGVWPGSNANVAKGERLDPQPIILSSPVFRVASSSGSTWANYNRVGFETDLPAIEFATVPACNTSTGANCVDPPVGAAFYPIYTVGTMGGNLGGTDKSYWQVGGAFLPGTTNAFGGSSTAEYGSLESLFYQSGPKSVVYSYEDFLSILNSNPNPSPLPG